MDKLSAEQALDLLHQGRRYFAKMGLEFDLDDSVVVYMREPMVVVPLARPDGSVVPAFVTTEEAAGDTLIGGWDAIKGRFEEEHDG